MSDIKNRTFSERIKLRIRLLWGVFLLMLCYMIIIGQMDLGDSRIMTPLADFASTTIFFGGLVYVIIQIVRNKKILKNRILLLSQSKKEADERQQFLHDKSGGIVVDIMLLFLLFVTCTAALTNMLAFNISFVILAVLIILKAGSYIIYSKIY